MAKIISVTNNKGGVGKTTTAVNLSAIFAGYGLTVALVDNDPQGNAGIYLGQNIKDFTYNMADVYRGLPMNKVAVRLDNLKPLIKEYKLNFDPANLHLFPSNHKLMEVDNNLPLTTLGQAIKAIENDYDLILIDNSPSLGFLTLSSILAADLVLIPTEARIAGITGLTELIMATDLINQRYQKQTLCRVFINDIQDTEPVEKKNLIRLKEIAGDRLYKYYVPSNRHLKRANEVGLPINLFERIMDISCPSAKSFRAIANLILMDVLPELIEKE